MVRTFLNPETLSLLTVPVIRCSLFPLIVALYKKLGLFNFKKKAKMKQPLKPGLGGF